MMIYKKKMKKNEPARSKLWKGRNSWLLVKHAWLYSDLLQALKGEHLSALFSKEGALICTQDPNT